MEDNKLIAEFMGLETSNGLVFQDANTKEFHSIKYHKDWNWLMPVVDKIENYLSKNVGKVGYFDECLNSNDLDIRYQAVVEFINEYNITNEKSN